jgi:hypothetical protein
MVKVPSLTYTLTQQALNLLRQIAAAPGWAKTIDEIYLGGKLIAETLPANDPVDWVKTDVEIAAMNARQKEAYLAKDRKWVTTEKTFSLTEKENAALKKAFEYVVAEGKLGASPHWNEIIRVLGWVKDE